MSAVSIAGLSRSFGTLRVLDRVDLEIADGEIMAILGASGCGKTTMLRIIAGFLNPHGGQVLLDGQAVATRDAQVPPQQRRVGYVPQEGALFPHLDVRGNILFGLPRRERTDDRLYEMLDLADLPHEVIAAYPHQLSGGQQQRVALARALAAKPRVVLLDEPFSSLDAALRASTGQEVMRVLRAAGTTAVMVTHDQGEALSLSDRVAVMRDGRIAQVAAPADLYAAPVDVEVASFVGGATVLPATLGDGVAVCALGVLEVAEPRPADGDVRVVVRPEQIRIVDDQDLPQAVVDEVGFFGPYLTMRMRLGGISVSARITAGPIHVPGDQVGVAVDAPVLAYPC